MSAELLLGTAGAPRRRRAGHRDRGHARLADPAAISTTEWARRASPGCSGRTIAGYDGLRRPLSPVRR